LPAIISSYGTQYQSWYQFGVLHRENDLPAYIGEDGSQIWYRNGIIHRDAKGDLPARIYPNGDQSWYQFGVLHRDNDLPAFVRVNGSKEWFKFGVRHRNEDLPAFIWAVRHRENDLPAHTHIRIEWWKHGTVIDLVRMRKKLYARGLYENMRKIVLMYVLGVPRDVGMEICNYIG
jgi:hypothetical protein